MVEELEITLIKREDRDSLGFLEHKGYGFVDKKADTAWSARAIWQNSGYPFDILYNRQSCTGPEDKRKELVKWLNETGLELLRAAFMQHNFRTKTSDYILLREGKFAIIGSPNASYGYAYLGAWIDG